VARRGKTQDKVDVKLAIMVVTVKHLMVQKVMAGGQRAFWDSNNEPMAIHKAQGEELITSESLVRTNKGQEIHNRVSTRSGTSRDVRLFRRFDHSYDF
jgi:hypothetical protein